MKNLMLCSALLLSACAASSQTLREVKEPIAGEWKGVLTRGDTRTVTEIEFSGREPRVTFWGSETMPIPPEGVRRPETPLANGRAIHFEVPRAGTFDGVVDGETMEGTFTDASGSGTFRLEKEPGGDDLRNAP